MDTSLPAEKLSTDDIVLQASQQLSSEFPYNVDSNSGNTIGISEVFLAFPHRLMLNEIWCTQAGDR